MSDGRNGIYRNAVVDRNGKAELGIQWATGDEKYYPMGQMLCNPKILYTFRMALHSWNAVSSYKEYVVIFTAIILFFYAFVNRRLGL